MNWAMKIDVGILLWIQEHMRAAFLTVFWRAVTFLGNGGWFWIVLGIVLVCMAKTRKVGITALLSLAMGALITNVWLKNFVARPRPFDALETITPLIAAPKDFSFPSGHTCASFAVALVCWRMLPRKYGAPLMALAALVAFSRLYLGVHYPSDVLGGFLVARLVSEVAYAAMKKWS